MFSKHMKLEIFITNLKTKQNFYIEINIDYLYEYYLFANSRLGTAQEGRTRVGQSS